ncbi:hypothetical protein [Paracoccus sulfuroxidans]|uniref:Uncharacterized protein n=1 Tax=Paracoccus sulfuroxidans TaxID=384678 RepID=A0A562NKT2_9RHOB|nr:hypothetical protein [Paracoccus sulfuroxidans]TWI32768.1 hypothetical protein IQ24_02643 [Paracoccus sulfuroxidans]
MDHHFDLDPAPCPRLAQVNRINATFRPLRVTLADALPQMDPATLAAIQTGAFKPEGR